MTRSLLRLFTLMSCSLFAALPAWSFFFGPPFDPAAITVEEYVQDLEGHTGHYMLVSEGAEKQFIENGSAGPGWHATGHRFGAFVAGSGRGADVCRFFAPGPVTRFYTANAAECDALRTHDLGWTFEGVRFQIDLPSREGTCTASRTQVNRLYNDRAQFNDTNHRYVSDPALRAAMVAQGWIDEGAAFCATSASFVAGKSFDIVSDKIRSVADCENEDLGGGGCLAMNGLAASFPTRIKAPIYGSTIEPFWSRSFSDITGYLFDVYTGQPPADTQAVAFHSFVQHGMAIFPASSKWGFHLNGVDRVGGSLASMEPMFQLSTRPPPPGGLEARVFPWRAERESYLDLAFDLRIQTILRPDASSHAYGAPMIEFRDVRGGGAIDVTMLTYATFPPGDFVGVMDPATGNVYVSTTFGANPSFGSRISGDFIACDGITSTSCAMANTYGFRITRADFAHVVAMARGADPALSADVNDYLLVNARFRNGVVNVGRLGVQLSNFKLDLYGY